MIKATVISTKMHKTAVVIVSKRVKHKKYIKFIIKKTKLFVHDPNRICSINDIIVIKKSKSFSKKKHWLVIGKELLK